MRTFKMSRDDRVSFFCEYVKYASTWLCFNYLRLCCAKSTKKLISSKEKAHSISHQNTFYIFCESESY